MKSHQLFSFTDIIASLLILTLVFTFLSPTGLFMPASALAENITYDGTQLQTDPVNNIHSSFYPTGGTSFTGNIITVESGTIPGSVYGGVSVTGSAVTDNTVILNGGTVDYNIYGGYLSLIGVANEDDKSSLGGSANASASVPVSNIDINNNAIFIGDNVSILGDLYGGYATLSVQGNTAMAGTSSSSSTANANASAYGSAISANINSITIGNNATVSGGIYGGYAAVSAQGGTATAGTSQGASRNSYANANAYADGSAISANINSITIGNNVTVSGGLYGGYAALTIKGGTAEGGSIASATGLASAYAYAYVSAPNSIINANENNVIIGDSVIVSDGLYGGYAALIAQGGAATAGTANTSVNTAVSTIDATISPSVINSTLDAGKNSIIMGNNVSVSGGIYGGYAALTVKSGNTKGGTANASSANASATANIDVRDSKIFADNNSVSLGNNIAVSGGIYGGYAALIAESGAAEGGIINAFYSSANANAFSNVTANNSTISASDNSVTLGNNGSVFGGLYGGYAAIDITAGSAKGGTAETSSTSANAYANSQAYAIGSNLSANNNSITIENNITVSDGIYGGYAALIVKGGDAEGGTAQASSANAYANAFTEAYNSIINANDNNVIIGDSVIVSGGLYGGYAALTIKGGTAESGQANGNPAVATAYININDTTVSASNNKVIFNGILVDENIYGGYVLFDIYAAEVNGNVNTSAVYTTDTSTTATNNTVTIGANAVLSATTSLYGGYLKYNSSYIPDNYDMFSDNTLNVASKHTIDGIYNFEYLGFTLPVGFSVGDSLINANTVNLDEYGTGAGSTVTGIDSMGVLSVGQTYALITASGGFSGTIANNTTGGVYNTGFMSGTYEWINVGVANNILTATLADMSTPVVNPEADAVSEGFAAGLAFLGQAADVRSSIYFAPQGPRFIPFVKMIYGKQYISTGSSVNVKGFSAIAGLALNTNFDNGSQLVVGTFVEGGWGDYNSRHSYSNSIRINGKGDTEYYGGGILGRYATAGGLYAEGTFVVGKTESDFRSSDFSFSSVAKYDYSAPYYSAHLAMGQILKLNDLLDLEIYGKYLWTRQEGDSVTILDHRFKFKDADSHRVRTGGKLKTGISPQLQPYVGAAYEYEFSGRIKGSLYGMNLDKPSLRGGTGIGELGLVWTPKDAQNLRVDLGLQGYAGKREGVSGGLTVTMSF